MEAIGPFYRSALPVALLLESQIPAPQMLASAGLTITQNYMIDIQQLAHAGGRRPLSQYFQALSAGALVVLLARFGLFAFPLAASHVRCSRWSLSQVRVLFWPFASVDGRAAVSLLLVAWRLFALRDGCFLSH